MIKLKELTEDLFKVDLKVKPYEKMIIDAVVDFMKKKLGLMLK